MTLQKTKVREIILKALNQSMKGVFGESGSFVVYRRLKENYLLKLEDILDKPQVFVKVLEQIFGDIGAEIIEALLTKDLCTKFCIKDGDDEIYSLVDCFNKLKVTCEDICKTRYIGD